MPKDVSDHVKRHAHVDQQAGATVAQVVEIDIDAGLDAERGAELLTG